MSTTLAITLRNLRFRYPGSDGFNLSIDRLDIDQGGRVACVGPSGSGKTTLIHLMTGVLSPHKGQVTLCGTQLDTLAEAGRRAERIARVGMVFQEFALLDSLNGVENILLPYFVSPKLRLGSEIRSRAVQLADELGIAHCMRRRPGRMSQGERQRVAIGRALVTHPRVIVCDEPTGNLDPRTAKNTLDLLFDQAQAHDATLIMVTHDHGLLDRFDRIINMTDLGVDAA